MRSPQKDVSTVEMACKYRYPSDESINQAKEVCKHRHLVFGTKTPEAFRARTKS
jgi:hypothetical protein